MSVNRAARLHRADQCGWLAALLGAVALVAATMAFGDLVQRAHLHGWIRTTGTVVANATGAEVAVRYDVAGQPRDAALPGWLGEDRTIGDRVETWYDPNDPADVVVADTTPLHVFPVAAAVGGTAVIAAGWLALAAARLLRPGGDGPVVTSPRPAPTGRRAGSTTAAPTAPREWLLAAAVPFLICLGALGWIVLHPEIQGDTQLGLAALTYAAALFGVRKWMRATTAAAAQRQSDAA